VTGCAGFVCSHPTEQSMRGGFDVSGVDCFTDYHLMEYKDGDLKNAREGERFILIEQDIASMGAFPAVGCVFRQAAQVGVQKSWANSEGTRSWNRRKDRKICWMVGRNVGVGCQQTITHNSAMWGVLLKSWMRENSGVNSAGGS